jgi:signal transduction histidine kinase
MSRFGIKIYTVLLIMGAVPFAVAVFLRQEIMIFDRGMQQEAISAIEFAAEIRKAWFSSFRGEADLTAKLLSQDPALRAVDWASLGHASSPPSDAASTAHITQHAAALSSARARLDRSLLDLDSLRAAAIVYRGSPMLSVGPPQDANPKEYRIFDVTYDFATARRLDHPDPATYPLTLSLTFVLPLKYFERFDALGEQRQLYLTLNDMDQTAQQSAQSLGQTSFHLVILSVVVSLTIAFALLITMPVNRRLARLTAATEQVAAGDLSVQVPISGRDEIAQLTERFNVMVSQLNEAHHRLKYLERVSVWQEVARRLAHEIKNPLTPLQLAIQQLDRKFDDYTDRPQRYRALVTEVVEIVHEEIETLQKLVKEFSEFARLPAVSLRAACLHSFVTRTLRSNPQISQAATVRHSPPPSPMWVKLDLALMRRVLVNVLQNAIEAVEPTGRAPEIDILYELLPDRAMVRVRILDNGPGILPEHIARLFQPYFTTKDKGTGLGLAIVRKILIDHGGDIALLNRSAPASALISPDRRSRDSLSPATPCGAEVRIDLPLSPPDPSAHDPEHDPEHDPDSSTSPPPDLTHPLDPTQPTTSPPPKALSA